MLFSVEQAFVGREEIRAPLKTPAWEATSPAAKSEKRLFFCLLLHCLAVRISLPCHMYFLVQRLEELANGHFLSI